MNSNFDFFISYSKTIYTDVVQDLVSQIKSYGICVWIDQLEVHLGDQIKRNLYHVLENFASYDYGVLLILDKSYFKKSWCLKELNYVIQHNISFFPVLYKIEKVDIPEQYSVLRNYNMVTIRNTDTDTDYAINKIMDVYIQRKEFQYQRKELKSKIFYSLITTYSESDKTNTMILILADNIALYIKIWYKKEQSIMDRYTQVLINIIHSKLLNFYSGKTITEYDMQLVCNSVEKLIKMYSIKL